MKTSGQITLLDQGIFYPGDERVVEISFVHQEYLGQGFGIGKLFTFYESIEPIGEGEVLDIL